MRRDRAAFPLKKTSLKFLIIISLLYPLTAHAITEEEHFVCEGSATWQANPGKWVCNSLCGTDAGLRFDGDTIRVLYRRCPCEETDPSKSCEPVYDRTKAINIVI